MKHILVKSILTLVGLSALTSCNGGAISTVAGTVSINGAPVDSGTIHFQSSNSSKSSGGGVITNGAFRVTSSNGFEPGEYSVVLQAFQKTGRTINDPQKGKVEETRPMDLREPSQNVMLSPEIAKNLSLHYAAASK